jgi:GntR family transcriptional repressor for pyruvate dehydrogenase complex
MLSESLERVEVVRCYPEIGIYGILKSIPQSGTFVANMVKIAINGIIDGFEIRNI